MAKSPPERIEQIASDLIEWSERPDTVHLAAFSTQYRRCRTWIYEIARDHPKVSDALLIARENIAHKLFTNGITGAWNYAMIQKFIGYFDKELDAYLDVKDEKRKQHLEKIAGDLLINITEYGNKKRKCSKG